MINKKLGRIKNFIPNAEFHFNVKRIHNRIKPKYEITLTLQKPGKDYVIKEKGWSLRFTINRCIKKLEKVIKKGLRK